MINFLLLMVIPVSVATIALFFFKGKVTIPEFAGQIAVVAFFVVVALGVAYWQNTSDVEIWNGEITDRQKVRVSCEHSYSCNCRQVCSGSGKNQSCYTHCDTCYEHPYDFKWRLWASTGESLDIDRIDRQGNNMPPRWGAAYLGEPFSSQHRYTNYILANPSSVLLGGRGNIEKFKALLPEYPSRVYDYYRADHVLNMGVPDVDMKVWSWLVNEVNKKLGPAKQVNIIVVFAKTDDPAYALAFKDKWVGGKKNDVVVLIGSVDGQKIAFADVVSWTPSAALKVELRDRIMQIGNLQQRDEIVGAIQQSVTAKFQRMHMKDYRYLVRSFQPSATAMWWIFGLATTISLGLAVYSIFNDIQEEVSEKYSRSSSRRGFDRRSHVVRGVYRIFQ